MTTTGNTNIIAKEMIDDIVASMRERLPDDAEAAAADIGVPYPEQASVISSYAKQCIRAALPGIIRAALEAAWAGHTVIKLPEPDGQDDTGTWWNHDHGEVIVTDKFHSAESARLMRQRAAALLAAADHIERRLASESSGNGAARAELPVPSLAVSGPAPATAYQLVRHDYGQLSGDGSAYVEVLEGHPPIPEAALLALRDRVGVGEPPERMRWWRGNREAWDAVEDLHMQADHETATALARLLHWVDQHTGGPQGGQVIFEIRPATLTDPEG